MGGIVSSQFAVLHLGFDLVQLTLLLMLTGGLENPFAVLILAPVVVSATVLARNHTIALGFLAGGCVTLLAFLHLPVPLGEPFAFALTPRLDRDVFALASETAGTVTIERTDVPAFSFQGHPEASPGPQDCVYLFDKFIDMMTGEAKDA